MSKETLVTLNTQTLIGWVTKRGPAWHLHRGLQVGEGNHFDGPVPLHRAVDLLDSVRLTVATHQSVYMDTDGVHTLTADDRKDIVRPRGSFGPDDRGAVLGTFMEGYTLHPYGEWLIRNSERILGHAEGELAISTAGLLRGGAVAWVQYEMPDNVTTAAGVTIRPFFAAVTSCNGSRATSYLTGFTQIVCDNTESAAVAEADRDGNRVKIRHTTGSLGRITEVRETLDLMVADTAAYRAAIDALAVQRVTPTQFETFLARWAQPGRETKKSLTMAGNKAAALRTLWATDERVAPWAGTKWGLYQAVSTYDHHVRTVKGDTRYARNQWEFLRGETAKSNSAVLDLIRAL